MSTEKTRIPTRKFDNLGITSDDIKEKRSWLAPKHKQIGFFRLAQIMNAAKRQEKDAIVGELLQIAKEVLNGGELREYLEQFTHIQIDDVDRYVNAYREALNNSKEPTPKEDWHAMLYSIGLSRKYNRALGWAAHRYKEKWGELPRFGVIPKPIEPAEDVKRWLRKQEIDSISRYKKTNERRERLSRTKINGELASIRRKFPRQKFGPASLARVIYRKTPAHKTNQ